MHSPHALYQALGENIEQRTACYRALFAGHMDARQIQKIRDASNKGLALGSERFKEEVEMLSGRRVRPLKPGPKPKKDRVGE